MALGCQPAAPTRSSSVPSLPDNGGAGSGCTLQGLVLFCLVIGTLTGSSHSPPPHLLARWHLLCHSVESHCYLSFHAPGHVRGQLSSSASPCCLSCISASALAPLLGGQDPPWGRGAPSATSLSHCFQLSPALWMHGSVCVVEFPQYQAFMCEKYSPYKARCTDRLG